MTGIRREDIDFLRGLNVAGTYPVMRLALDAAERSLTEQSRIDAAVEKERERCAAQVRQVAGFYSPGVQQAFETLATWIEEGHPAIRTPTPTTEEGA